MIKEVLVIGKTKHDAPVPTLLKWFEGKEYNLHFIKGNYPNTTSKLKRFLEHESTLEFSTEVFISDVCAYVWKHGIDGIVGYSDIDMLHAAIASERCGLPGPKPESVFLCFHKYYCRVAEQPKLWFTGIDVYDDVSWRSEVRYPCWVKPVYMQATIGGQRVDNEEEMERVVESYKGRFDSVSELYTRAFDMAVDKKNYPNFDKILLIAEELVCGEEVSQHCVEGWVDKDGNCRIFSIDDDKVSDTTVFSYEMLPSAMSIEELQVVETEGRHLVKSTGLRSCVFTLEVFLRRENGKLRTDTIEINHRAPSCHTECYMGLYGTSPACTAVLIACGENEKAIVETECMNPRKVEKKYALQAVFQARRSGYVSEIVNLDAVEYYKSNASEGVFQAAGMPGVLFDYCAPSDYITLTEEGTRLGHFYLFGSNPSALEEKMELVRNKITN